MVAGFKSKLYNMLTGDKSTETYTHWITTRFVFTTQSITKPVKRFVFINICSSALIVTVTLME